MRYDDDQLTDLQVSKTKLSGKSFEIKYTNPPEKNDKPKATWESNGGVATLNWMDSNHSFDWSVDITKISTLPFWFKGELDISTIDGKYVDSLSFSGSGAGTASGLVNCMSLTPGSYQAKFSGVGLNATGRVFWTSPDEVIVYYYYYYY